MALTNLAKIMGGINFVWLDVWVLSPDWLSDNLQVCEFFRRLREAAAPGVEECGSCPDFAFYTLAYASQLRKIMVNLIQDTRKALG